MVPLLMDDVGFCSGMLTADFSAFVLIFFAGGSVEGTPYPVDH